MPFSQFDVSTGFKAGADAGGKKSGVLDIFDEQRRADRELDTYRQKKSIDASFKTESQQTPLEKARENYYNAQANKLNTTVEGEYLTPSQKNQKNKLVSSIYSQIEANKVKRDQIAQAKDSLTRLPKGKIGGMYTNFISQFDPENPIAADWQKVKSVLTDAQLLFTARTKGAISDREMELFSKAAANDDMASVARMSPVLDRLQSFIDAEQNAAVNSFSEIYGEDPMQWEGMNNPIQQASKSQSGSPLRQEAEQAIARGADPTKVAERYRQQTGENF